MELAWQPELADVAEALAVQSRARKSPLKMAAVLAVCLLLLLVGLFLSAQALEGTGAGGLVAGGAVWLMRPLFVRRLWRRTPPLREPVTATVTADQGIETRTASGSSVRPWSGIDGFYETNRVFVIRPAGSHLTLIMLAKRGTAGPEEVDELRRLLSMNLHHYTLNG